MARYLNKNRKKETNIENNETLKNEELNQHLLDSFRMVGAVIRRQAMGNDPFGNNFAQQRALAVLAMQDNMTQSQLGYILGIRPQSVGELCQKLEKSELIQRETDADDKRIIRLKLTEAGRKQVNVPTNTGEQFAMLNETQKQQLADLLDEILAHTPQQLKEPRHCGPDGHHFGHGPRMPFMPRPAGPRGPFTRFGFNYPEQCPNPANRPSDLDEDLPDENPDEEKII
jgi:DNA-binding MarR family transcriptional regulator